MKSMPSGAPIASVPGEEWAPQTATYFSRCCRAEGACLSRYLTFLVVKLDFIRIIAYNTMQHHPARSTNVLGGTRFNIAWCYTRPPAALTTQKPRPLHILQLQRVSLLPAHHCQQLRKFSDMLRGFPKCICRKTWMYIVDRNPSLAISNQRWDGDSVTTHGVQELCGSKTSSLNIFPSHMWHLFDVDFRDDFMMHGSNCGWLVRRSRSLAVWNSTKALVVSGQVTLKGAYHVHHYPCKLLGRISLVSFDTLISSNPFVQTWNLLMDENDEK